MIGSDGAVRERKRCSKCNREFFSYDRSRCMVCREIEIPSPKQTMRRYPALTAHVICASLGYATPSTAARIIRDYRYGFTNYCEWIDAYWNGDPEGAVRRAWLGRHHHRGYMADYNHAKVLVQHSLETDEEPIFASWF